MSPSGLFKKNAAAQWHAASSELSAIFQTEPTLWDGFGGQWKVKRKGLAQHTGSYELHNAFLAALAPKPRLVAEDPFSRKAVCLNRWRQPVQTASLSKVVRAWPRALSASLRPNLPVVEHAVVLGGFYTHSNNYFHYWVDVLADWWFLQQCYPDLGSPHLVLPFEGLQWQQDILTLCNIPPERVLALSDISALRINRLRVAVRTRGGRINPPWLLKALRNVSGFSSPQQLPWRRIYVSRLGVKRRPLFNEQEVIDALAHRGFDIIDAGLLSVAEQQRLFSEAALIVASHGAALTNLAWCHHSARVLEFLPQRHRNPCFSDMARMLGMGYHAMVCPQDAQAQNVIEAGFSVPIEQLLRRIDELSSE